jgi:uncharacterized membrane protein SirB2
MDYLAIKTIHETTAALSVAGFFARGWGSFCHAAWVRGRLAKIIGLLVYIGLGLVALRPGRPTAVRAVAWVAALATFGYIVSVAITKNPLGVLALVAGWIA